VSENVVGADIDSSGDLATIDIGALASWVSREQQETIEYLPEENRILKGCGRLDEIKRCLFLAF
jgi:hypothetical protein